VLNILIPSFVADLGRLLDVDFRRRVSMCSHQKTDRDQTTSFLDALLPPRAEQGFRRIGLEHSTGPTGF